MEKDVLNTITKHLTAERFDKIVSNDETYLKKQDKIEKYAKQFEELGLSKDQRLIIDRLLSANNESNYRYSELAYMQGFKDCVELLKTIDVIKV